MTVTDADIRQRYVLTITFTEPLLGHKKDSKHATHSYFYKDRGGRPLLLDRHVMGFFKEAAQALDWVYGEELEGTLTRKVFITPKEMLLELPDGASIEVVDCPPHLVKVNGRKVETIEPTSEAAPIGTVVTCELIVYPGVEEEVLVALLDYGGLKGIGLGRNQGFGKFRYKLKVSNDATLQTTD